MPKPGAGGRGRGGVGWGGGGEEGKNELIRSRLNIFSFIIFKKIIMDVIIFNHSPSSTSHWTPVLMCLCAGAACLGLKDGFHYSVVNPQLGKVTVYSTKCAYSTSVTPNLLQPVSL